MRKSAECKSSSDPVEAAFAEISRSRPLSLTTSREITVAVMGAGSRGQTYTAFGRSFPGTLRVVAVADVQKSRRDRMARLWKVPTRLRFGDFREMLAAVRGGKLADVLIVSRPDHLHYGAAMEAMRQG